MLAWDQLAPLGHQHFGSSFLAEDGDGTSPCYTANQLVQFEAQLVALIHFRVCLVGVLLVAFKPVCPV